MAKQTFKENGTSFSFACCSPLRKSESETHQLTVMSVYSDWTEYLLFCLLDKNFSRGHFEIFMSPNLRERDILILVQILLASA